MEKTKYHLHVGDVGTVTLPSSLFPPGRPPPPTFLILPYVLVLCSARALDHCGVWTFTELPLIKQNKGGWTGPGVRKGWRSPTHGLARRRWVLVRETERESLVMCIHRQRLLGRPRVNVLCRGWARYVVGSTADINVARNLAPNRILGHSNTREVNFLY
jgi:hypothetical protein